MHAAKFAESIQASEQLDKQSRNFKAHPIPDSANAPFQVKKNEKELTTCDDIVLHTEVRAEHRADFDESLKTKENELEKLKEMQQKQDEVRVLHLFYTLF